jgi:hypothetical protein
MIEFSFRVVLQYGDAQAFIDEDLERVHDRLTKRMFDALADEFAITATVEVEPT